jgi:unsaturated rhamnogalacturonyl hydrolase
MKTIFIKTLIVLILCNNNLFSQEYIPFSENMAETIIKRTNNIFGGWDYQTATVLKGFQDIWVNTLDSAYFDYIKSTVDYAVSDEGIIRGYNKEDYNIDNIREGCAALFLYKQTGEQKYKTAADSLISQLKTHPRTSDGGFWHKNTYPDEMWLDGLYMAEPFYCEYGALVNDTSIFEDVALQLKLMEKHARDEETGLLYHGWDEDKTASWADPITGCSPSFWGRSIGWYSMALIDVLDFFPKDMADQDSIVMIYQRLAESIKNSKDNVNHVWWQVVDSIYAPDNWMESSVSCMFVYALAKGIRMGYIDSTYLDVVKKGFRGIISNFIDYDTDYGSSVWYAWYYQGPWDYIRLNNTCIGTGVGAYDYYLSRARIINDSKGIGPFIMASVEMERTGMLMPPSMLTADSVGIDSIFLTWKDNSFNEKGFILEKNNGDGFKVYALIDSNTVQYTDILQEVERNNLIYRISSYNMEDTATNSKVYKYSDTPRPIAKPINLFPPDSSVNLDLDVTLSWDKDPYSDFDVVKYIVWIDTVFAPFNSIDVITTTHKSENLKPGARYYWGVSECMSYEPNSIWCPSGSVQTFTTKPAPVNIERQVQNNNIYLYPNPADAIINIEILTDLYQDTRVIIYNLLGIPVVEQRLDTKTNVIDISNISRGIFVVKIAAGTNTICTERLILK